MIELYTFEQTLKMERQLLDQQSARRASWNERQSATAVHKMVSPRRRLALALLALADRLDPRPVVSAAHTPGRPVLNGTLHHA